MKSVAEEKGPSVEISRAFFHWVKLGLSQVEFIDILYMNINKDIWSFINSFFWRFNS